MIYDLDLPLGAAAILGAIVFATDACPQDIKTWNSAAYSSYIRLQPTTNPEAVAEVEFKNAQVHGITQTERFTLSIDGMSVEVIATTGNGMTPDRMEVIPPDGFVAIPQVIDVEEDDTGIIYIYAGGATS